MLNWLRTNRNEETYITQERIKLLFGELVPTLIVLILVNTILAYLFFEDYRRTEIILWAGTVCSTALIRILLGISYWKKHQTLNQKELFNYEDSFFFFTVVNALFMGMGFYYFWPEGNYQHQMLLVVCSSGFVSGATANYSSSPKTAFSYGAILGASLILAELSKGKSWIDDIVIILVVIFFLVMTKTLKRNFLSIKNQLELKTSAILLANDLKETNKSLIETQSKAIEQQKLATIGIMSAGVAHEINNPLAVVKGYSEKVNRDLDKLIFKHQREFSPELKEKIQKLNEKLVKINNATTRIAGIIKGLKTLSRDGTNDDFKKESLEDMFNDTLFILESSLKNKNIEFIPPEFKSKILINSRSVQLCQVFSNLIINSIDALESNQTTDHKWIQVKLVEENNSVLIYFIDSGSGIPISVSEKMMTPFYTTKETGKGTGLGLSISSKIIEEHQGTLRYDQGAPNTTFILELPKASLDNQKAA